MLEGEGPRKDVDWKAITEGKKFYSEKYMSAMGLPLVSDSTKQEKPFDKVFDEVDRPLENDTSEIETIEGAITSSKRARLIHSH